MPPPLGRPIIPVAGRVRGDVPAASQRGGADVRVPLRGRLLRDRDIYIYPTPPIVHPSSMGRARFMRVFSPGSFRISSLVGCGPWLPLEWGGPLQAVGFPQVSHPVGRKPRI